MWVAVKQNRNVSPLLLDPPAYGSQGPLLERILRGGFFVQGMVDTAPACSGTVVPPRITGANPRRAPFACSSIMRNIPSAQ